MFGFMLNKKKVLFWNLHTHFTMRIQQELVLLAKQETRDLMLIIGQQSGVMKRQ
jgi:hypothetical protein